MASGGPAGPGVGSTANDAIRGMDAAGLFFMAAAVVGVAAAFLSEA